MGTRYSSQTIVGYNATPPPDDGSQTAANELTWAKHKTKLGDPIKTLAEAINTALLAHTDESTLDIGSNTTTSLANHKRTLNVTGAFTITLADAATVAANYLVRVKNSHSAAITVDLDTPADTLDGAAGGSISVPPGECIEFGTNAGADGYLVLSRVDDFTEVNSAGDVNDALGDVRVHQNFLTGLDTSLAADTDHDVTVATGACADSTAVFYMNLASTITKQIDADWAEGNNLGGLASGARAVANTPDADTTYHFFLIAQTDGTIDAGWDTSLTATNLLADAATYTYYRRIASMPIDSSNNITAYFQRGDRFILDTFVRTINDTSPGTSENLYVMDIPIGLELEAIIYPEMQFNSNSAQALITSPLQTDVAPAINNHNLRVNGSHVFSHNEMIVTTNTSGEIRYRQNDTNPDIAIHTQGWIDRRAA
jgi:hypothetical protein